MKYRTLGRTTLEVSAVGIGTWQLSGDWGKLFVQSEVDAIFAKAREVGINLVDTAECYGDHLAEQFIGAAVAGDRERWILATKFGHRFCGPFERTRDYSPDSVVRQLDASLRALRTDYIDLYQFHSGPTSLFETPRLWQALRRQVELVKVQRDSYIKYERYAKLPWDLRLTLRFRLG